MPVLEANLKKNDENYFLLVNITIHMKNFFVLLDFISLYYWFYDSD